MNVRSLVDRALDAAVVPGFSSVGYAIRSRISGWDRLPPMGGRSVLITGGTGGLGLAAATRLASLGASVTVAARDKVKIDRTVEQLNAIPGAGPAAGIADDLSLVAGVRRVAAQAAAAGPLHVLINNVGVLLPQRTVTEEGIEATLATNLLGHYVLTEELVPLLAANAPSRIVNVSSGGMYTQGIALNDLQNERGYRGSVAYARTKRGQVILTEWWAERLRDRGIVVHAMHPGWVDTEGVRTSLPVFRTLTAPILRDTAQGADTIAWLAAADEPARSSGRFWHDRTARPVHRVRATRQTPGEREMLAARLQLLAATT